MYLYELRWKNATRKLIPLILGQKVCMNKAYLKHISYIFNIFEVKWKFGFICSDEQYR